MKPGQEEMTISLQAGRVASDSPGMLADLMELTKARLSSLVLVTTFVGFCLASRGEMNWILLLHTLAGTALVAFGASAFNQLLERREDGAMRRTSARPLPAGRMDGLSALVIGSVLTVNGLVYLGLAISWLVSGLAGLTFVVYVLLYTPLKKASSLCTLVGAVSGAVPPVIGWCAAGGGLGAAALALFGILFFWQLPHFLAINWIYRDDYERAGFVMWSNRDGRGERTSRLALLFSGALMVMAVTPAGLGISTAWYLWGALALGLGMVLFAIRFRMARSIGAARGLFVYSILYLPLLMGLMLFTRAY